MAVLVTKSPGNYSTLKPSVVWSFQMDTEGIYPIEYRMFYQLFLSGVGAITERRVVNYSANPLRVDFSEVMAGQVHTPLLSPLSDRAITDVNDEQTADFFVSYGELVLNRETGVQVEQGAANTGQCTVMNGVVPYDELDLISNTENDVFLTRREKYFKTCKSQYDWIYVRVGREPIWLKTSFNTGLIPFIITPLPVELAAYTIWAIPVGGANLADAWSADATYAEVVGATETVRFEFYRADPDADPDQTPFEVYTAEMNSCCEDGNQTELYFLEGPGGYASFRFDEVDYGANRQYSRVESAWDVRGNLEYRLKFGGASVASTTTFQTLRLSTRLPAVSEQQEKFLRQIYSSEYVYLKHRGPDGVFYPLRVLVDGGQFTTRRLEEFTELVVNIRANKDLLSL